MIQDLVRLRPEDHTYWHVDSRQFYSVSSVLHKIEEPFDSETMSYYSAKKKLSKGSSEKLIREMQKIILQEWDDLRNLACDVGTNIHKALEVFCQTTEIIYPELEGLIRSIAELYVPYKQCMDEVCLFSEEFGVAGTADKLCFRKNGTVDIYDYKTNLKGINFESKYGKYFLKPFDHLEECNYNKYALQLSAYAYMLESQFGMKVGKLNLVHINYTPGEVQKEWRLLPIPYLKHEARELLALNKVKATVIPKSKVKKEEIAEVVEKADIYEEDFNDLR